MKTKLFLLAGICTLQMNAQFGPQQNITTNASQALSVFAADLDQDGDMDVLSASYLDNRISWYENRLNDTENDFGILRVISADALGPLKVFAADLDGDGDMDVLSASYLDNKIAWYENRLNASEADFGPQQVITTNAMQAAAVIAADLDGDGDMDVLSASLDDDKVAWYENRLNDTEADFGPQQIITTAADFVRDVFTADFDLDGDLDVVSASGIDNKIAWYENRLNDTEADFGPQQVISTDLDLAVGVHAADLDDDGDMDVLSASRLDNKIAWYENRLNASEADFGPQQVITTAAFDAFSVYTADIDGDGDLDALSASEDDHKIAWYENRLNASEADFGPQQTITTNAAKTRSVYAADLDGDSDIDVLSASWEDDKVAWYENLRILNVEDENSLNFSVYPSPTDGVIHVKSLNTITNLAVYDMLSQLVRSNSGKKEIDISSLPVGVYLLRVMDDQNNSGSMKVVKK